MFASIELIIEKVSEVNDFSENSHANLHTFKRSLEETTKETHEWNLLTMEESVDISMNKAEQKNKAQKGYHILQIQIRKNKSCKRWKTWPQNHTAAEAGRNLWRSSSLNPCSEQAQLEQAAQGHVHLGSEYP